MPDEDMKTLISVSELKEKVRRYMAVECEKRAFTFLSQAEIMYLIDECTPIARNVQSTVYITQQNSGSGRSREQCIDIIDQYCAKHECRDCPLDKPVYPCDTYNCDDEMMNRMAEKLMGRK